MLKRLAYAAGPSALLMAAPTHAQDATGSSAPGSEPAGPGDLSFIGALLDWTRESHAQEPQLVTVVIGLLLILPLISLAALTYFGGARLVKRLRYARAGSTHGAAPIGFSGAPKRTVPALEIVDDGATALPVRGPMVRIGRHEENDICLSNKTVHRYHAVLHLSPDDSYVISDISGNQGNGVFVNAERIEHATLCNGDLIEIGDVKLRFRLNELH